jgi:hypothetical protein
MALEGVFRSWAAGSFDSLLAGLDPAASTGTAGSQGPGGTDPYIDAAAWRWDAPKAFVIRATDYDTIGDNRPTILNLDIRSKGPWPADLRLLRIIGLKACRDRSPRAGQRVALPSALI